MYYTLTETQSRMIVFDFQHLIGKRLHKKLDLLIEEMEEQIMQDGTWQVYLKTYLGDKEGFWQTAGHSSMMTNFFFYLTENDLIHEFDPTKYGLTPQQKVH